MCPISIIDMRNLSSVWDLLQPQSTPSLWCGNPSSEEDGWASEATTY